jgi:hypothetical protein
MQIIKPVLIVCFLIFLVSAFRHRDRVGLRAGSRLLALALSVVAIVAVADPDIPQAIATLLGVARGTDLILYTSVVVFALTTLGLYFRVREANVRLQLLARRVALSDAVQMSGPPGQQVLSAAPPAVAAALAAPEVDAPVPGSPAPGSETPSDARPPAPGGRR